MTYNSGNPISKIGHPGVYIHYPYCIQKCEYCDFYSVGNDKNKVPDEAGLFQRYKEEITTRISDNPFISKLEFDTIFFGGGTPSRAEVSEISDLIVFFAK